MSPRGEPHLPPQFPFDIGQVKPPSKNHYLMGVKDVERLATV